MAGGKGRQLWSPSLSLWPLPALWGSLPLGPRAGCWGREGEAPAQASRSVKGGSSSLAASRPFLTNSRSGSAGLPKALMLPDRLGRAGRGERASSPPAPCGSWMEGHPGGSEPWPRLRGESPAWQVSRTPLARPQALTSAGATGAVLGSFLPTVCLWPHPGQAGTPEFKAGWGPGSHGWHWTSYSFNCPCHNRGK